MVEVLAGRVFVAHNARFDWNFVNAEVRRARDLALDGPRLCTVRLARRLVKGIISCGLDSLTHWFGFSNGSRHRAAGDAWVTAEVLERLLALARDEGARTLQDLAAIESSPGAASPPAASQRHADRAARRLRAGGTLVTLSQSFQVGGLRCHLLEGGFQRLDGGAMFGVVPYTLWSRRVPHDDRHRILLALRCLLVEHPDGPVLIDTGLGNKEDRKFLDIYGVENDGLEGATQLEDALAVAGFLPRRREMGDQHSPPFRSRRRQHHARPGAGGRPPSPRAARLPERDLRGAEGRAGVRAQGERADPGQLSAAQLRADRLRGPVAIAGGRR